MQKWWMKKFSVLRIYSRVMDCGFGEKKNILIGSSTNYLKNLNKKLS
jgi:hypothetical protein